MPTSFMQVGTRLSGVVFGSDVVGKVALLGAVAAGAAFVEAALVPGLVLGGAAVLAPRLVPRGLLRGLQDRLKRTAPPQESVTPALDAQSAQPADSAELAPFDTWNAVVKTVTYRVIVTTVDFGANYVVIGELALAAGLSSLSLVAGPIAYFTHEAAWHYFGPASARNPDPRKATVRVPIPGLSFASINVSRAFGKTVTYEAVTGASEFGANYFFVRDFAAAAGLTAFSMLIAPLVYYVHEKAWDYYKASKTRSGHRASHPGRQLSAAMS